jgi:hypothetical protein
MCWYARVPAVTCENHDTDGTATTTDVLVIETEGSETLLHDADR